MADTFKAFIVDRTDDQMVAGIRDITKDDLPEREVIVRVDYSSVNYKDGLAITGKGPILKSFPIVPGVDYAGAKSGWVMPLPDRFTIWQAMGRIKI